MRRQFLVISFILLGFVKLLQAQQSHAGAKGLKFYQKGILAFEQKNYGLARHFFEVSKSKRDASLQVDVYLLLIDVYLNEPKSSFHLEEYLEKNRYSTYHNDLKLALANSFFDRKKIAKALKWYQKVDVKHLSEDQELDYDYKLAFAHYNAQYFEKAQQYLRPLSKGGVYKHEALYYLANIAIHQKEYQTALSYFGQMDGTTKFQKEIEYQKMVIYFHQKKYEILVKKGPALVQKTFGAKKLEMAKMVGESFFYKDDFVNALPYLLLYKGKRKKMAETDYYLIGFCYYQQNLFSDAILYFNKITGQQSEVAQNAHYHMADCYLKLDKKLEALNAFKNASEMNFDANVKEDAFLNYAKLGYLIGNPYEGSSSVMQRFVAHYPNSAELSKVKSYIVNAYFQAKDYDGLIAYYNQEQLIKDEVYFKSMLEKGLWLFSDYQYQEALNYFKKANNISTTKVLQAKANFWQAETLYELHQYQESISVYQLFLNSFTKDMPLYLDVLYVLAYACYHQQKYTDALQYFKRFAETKNNPRESKIRNALLRIGDCYYVQKKYTNALGYYHKIIALEEQETDYALYQKALCYGFLSQKSEKIKCLNILLQQYPKSAYADKALYQLGNVYANQNQSELALEAYQNLSTQYSKSPLLSRVALKKALIYYNIGKNEEAISTLKKVVKDYPSTSEAVQAVTIVKQVYQDMDRVGDYAIWVRNLEFVNISQMDLDKTMFEVVEDRFLKNNLSEVITSGQKYLIEYPQGIYALTVHFYLAESYHYSEQDVLAIPHFDYVIHQNTNEYSAQSYLTLSQIYMEQEQWDNAFPLLKEMEENIASESNVKYAQSNLMKYYALKKQHRKVLEYAEKLIVSSDENTLVLKNAYLYGARSAIALNKYEISEKYYKKLETLGTGAVVAEAYYYKAYGSHLKRKYEQSNQEIQFLTSTFQEYKYFGVKGLLLMAENYKALKDDFQATYILTNILENAQEYPDIIQKAEHLLEEYRPKPTEEINVEETDF